MNVGLDESAIEAAIDRLHAHRRAPGYTQARSELMKELDALVPDGIARILAVGERCLRSLGDSPHDVDRANSCLHLIFDFFESRRLPEVRVLVERALETELFRMKERYIQTLEELGDPASLPCLLTLLVRHRGGGIEDEDVRIAVLRALTGYFSALPDPAPVLHLLHDESLRVRHEALKYVSGHAIDVPGPVLAARAREEADPELLGEVMALLERVDPSQALAVANERLSSTQGEDAELVEALELTVERLRARQH